MDVYFPSWAVLALPETGDRNEFKHAALTFLYTAEIFPHICAHDYDIVTLGNDPTPVYCCAICDKVGPPVLS
jgi:hypothetical protein